MGHCQQHVLIAIALMAASILHGVPSTATSPSPSPTKWPEYPVTTAYDVLAQNNLPLGLFPLGIQSYELKAGGAFELTLPGECDFFVTFADKKIKFRFDQNGVSGTIKPGSISRLSGTWIVVDSALRVFNQVSRAGNLLNFRLENNSIRSFPASAFAQSANCSGLLAA